MAWFIKIERGIVDKAIFDQYVPAHKAYVQQLNEQGHQARTGYWRDSPGGMLFFRAETKEAATQLVEADPLIANHCVEYDLHEWVQVSGEPL
ncbi:MAG: hypothetical protein HC934_01870 [Acaryochloridaceae cyanobacterium SU_2_1]|nr:hypothetical protein [Acaryochloridaceae cyanobacterium SU_2_1]